jgi:hypothetical protein
MWAKDGLEKEGLQNKYRPKDVYCLMAKIRKELKSIETTGIPERPTDWVNFFFGSNLCII